MNMLVNVVRNVFYADEEPADVPAAAPAPPSVPVPAIAPAASPAPTVVYAAPTFTILSHDVTVSGRPAFRVSRGNGRLETLYEYEMTEREKEVLLAYRAQVSGVAWVQDDEDYDVKKIVDHRKVGTSTFFLIEWRGARWENPVWRSEQREVHVRANRKIASYMAHATNKTEQERQDEKPDF